MRYSTRSRVPMAVMACIARAASSTTNGLDWLSCQRRRPCSNPSFPCARYDWTEVGKSSKAMNCLTISPLTPTSSPRRLFVRNAGSPRRYFSARAVKRRSLVFAPFRLRKQIANASFLSEVRFIAGTCCLGATESWRPWQFHLPQLIGRGPLHRLPEPLTRSGRSGPLSDNASPRHAGRWSRPSALGVPQRSQAPDRGLPSRDSLRCAGRYRLPSAGRLRAERYEWPVAPSSCSVPQAPSLHQEPQRILATFEPSQQRAQARRRQLPQTRALPANTNTPQPYPAPTGPDAGRSR